jgi:hypothetical protein
VYLSNTPALIFIFMGLVDFCHIRSIGFNRVVKYSFHFKMKLYTVLLIVINEVIRVALFIIFHVWWDSHFGDAEKEAMCKQHFAHDAWYTTLSIVTTIAWFGVLNLMIYQYRKGLNETWYSLKLFWILNCVDQIYLFIYGLSSELYTTPEIVFRSIDMLLGIVIVILMWSTIKRTAEKPRGNKIADSTRMLELDPGSNLRQSRVANLFSSLLGEPA